MSRGALLWLLGAASALLLAFGAGHRQGSQRMEQRWKAVVALRDAEHTRALLDAEQRARTFEQQLAADLATIGETHAQETEQAAAVEADLLAGLAAGTVRLRREWQRCETARVSGAAATTAERDAATAERDRLAAAVVRAGREADAQLAACQSVIRAYVTSPHEHSR